LTDEVFKTVHQLSSFLNAEVERRADAGDADAAIDYGFEVI